MTKKCTECGENIQVSSNGNRELVDGFGNAWYPGHEICEHCGKPQGGKREAKKTKDLRLYCWDRYMNAGK
jgi:hypothetical protein